MKIPGLNGILEWYATRKASRDFTGDFRFNVSPASRTSHELLRREGELEKSLQTLLPQILRKANPGEVVMSDMQMTRDTIYGTFGMWYGRTDRTIKPGEWVIAHGKWDIYNDALAREDLSIYDNEKDLEARKVAAFKQFLVFNMGLIPYTELLGDCSPQTADEIKDKLRKMHDMIKKIAGEEAMKNPEIKKAFNAVWKEVDPLDDYALWDKAAKHSLIAQVAPKEDVAKKQIVYRVREMHFDAQKYKEHFLDVIKPSIGEELTDAQRVGRILKNMTMTAKDVYQIACVPAYDRASMQFPMDIAEEMKKQGLTVRLVPLAQHYQRKQKTI